MQEQIPSYSVVDHDIFRLQVSVNNIERVKVLNTEDKGSDEKL